MASTIEKRLIRTDYELMQLDLPPTTKGEAIERLLKVELERHIDKQFTKGRIRTTDGILTPECDLIVHSSEPTSEQAQPTVPVENVICVLESKTDISCSALENRINDWIKQVQSTADVPVFLVAIRHFNKRATLRDVSAADVTVAWGTLREKGDAEAMAHTGEFDRLVAAIQRAEQEFDHPAD